MRRVCVFAGSASGARPEYRAAASEMAAREIAHDGLTDLRVVSSAAGPLLDLLAAPPASAMVEKWLDRAPT